MKLGSSTAGLGVAARYQAASGRTCYSAWVTVSAYNLGPGISEPYANGAGGRVQHLPRRVRVALEEFVRRAHQKLGSRLLQVVLYGSQARGTAHGASDVDLFVRARDLTHTERAALFELAAEVSLEHLVTLQVFAPGAEELGWLERHECRILRDISSQGIEL